MDYAESLRYERESPHAAFHQYIAALPRADRDSYFFFLEGHDDWVFYGNYISQRMRGVRLCHFVCGGRDKVIKAHELCARDGRNSRRMAFFVDKDHSDILGDDRPSSPRIFQTCGYSFENYIVCVDVLRRFWAERLRLGIGEQAYADVEDTFRVLMSSFIGKMKILFHLILLGHTIG